MGGSDSVVEDDDDNDDDDDDDDDDDVDVDDDDDGDDDDDDGDRLVDSESRFVAGVGLGAHFLLFRSLQC